MIVMDPFIESCGLIWAQKRTKAGFEEASVVVWWFDLRTLDGRLFKTAARLVQSISRTTTRRL
jgi:hypothetical protein